MVKVSGAEWKAFMNDEAYWGKDTYFDDAEFTLNGEVKPDDLDFDTTQIANTDILEVVNGGIYSESKPEHNNKSLESMFRRWRKLQTHTSFVVTCKKDHVEAIKRSVKLLGGKVS